MRPIAAEQGLWQRERENLLELTVVSQMEIAAENPTGATEIVVSEASGPECPRCWRRTGSASGYAAEPNLCVRCAAVVSLL